MKGPDIEEMEVPIQTVISPPLFPSGVQTDRMSQAHCTQIGMKKQIQLFVSITGNGFDYQRFNHNSYCRLGHLDLISSLDITAHPLKNCSILSCLCRPAVDSLLLQEPLNDSLMLVTTITLISMLTDF